VASVNRPLHWGSLPTPISSLVRQLLLILRILQKLAHCEYVFLRVLISNRICSDLRNLNIFRFIELPLFIISNRLAKHWLIILVTFSFLWCLLFTFWTLTFGISRLNALNWRAIQSHISCQSIPLPWLLLFIFSYERTALCSGSIVWSFLVSGVLF